MYKNNRAQAGETITWLFATIIIVVVLLVSILVASILEGPDKKVQMYPEDLLAQRTFLSYLLTKGTSGQIIYNEINGAGDFNSDNGNLAATIFKNLYDGYYNWALYLGINLNIQIGYNLQSNKYFNYPPGVSPNTMLTPIYPFSTNVLVLYSVILNNNKAFQLALWHTS